MEPRLLNFEECCENIGLFAKFEFDTSKDGLFVRSYNNVPFRFVWRCNGRLHRLDGPATICSDGDKDWWFLGERVYVDNQNEFYEFVAKQISEA